MAAFATANPSALAQVAPNRIVQNFANAGAIAPSDTAGDFSTQPFDVYVGVTGDVTVIPWLQGSAGTAVLFKNAPQGYRLPIRVGQVKATGTTATNLVGIF